MKEVVPEAASRVRWAVIVEEQAAELLASPDDLAPPVTSPAVVPNREVKQLECAIQRAVKPAGPGLPRPNRTLHLTPDVCQLLRQRERVPPPGRELVMHHVARSCAEGQSGTSIVTT